MALVPASRSILDVESLAAWVAEHYALSGTPSCSLIRFNWNDTYRVQDGDARYILRVYGRGRRRERDILRELDLVGHVSRAGIHACAALAARNGRFVLELQAAEGPRCAVLLEHARGRVVVPRSETDSAFLGAALAKLHTAADSFGALDEQPVQDAAYLLDEPVAHLHEVLEGRPADIEFVRATAQRVRQKLGELTEEGLDWGAIHGDPFSNNATVTEDGEVMWYDFDNSGAGYRAQDFAVPFWSARASGKPAVLDAFVTAYREHRAFGERDLHAVPWLCIAQFIRTLWEVPAARAPLHGGEIAQTIADARVKQIHTALKWLPG